MKSKWENIDRFRLLFHGALGAMAVALPFLFQELTHSQQIWIAVLLATGSALWAAIDDPRKFL